VAVIADGVPDERVAVSCSVDLRYRGQSGTLTLEVNGLGPGTHVDLHRRFNELHRKTFGFEDLSDPIEVVSVRATGSGRRDGIALGYRTGDAPHAQRSVETVIDHLSGPTRIPLIGRADLHMKGTVAGPMLVLDSGSTTFLRPGWSLTVSEGCLVLIRAEQLGPGAAALPKAPAEGSA
jgi:N-methylhydantoinase A/oxoprolinase/acetone carboxylase beta subunit